MTGNSQTEWKMVNVSKSRVLCRKNHQKSGRKFLQRKFRHVFCREYFFCQGQREDIPRIHLQSFKAAPFCHLAFFFFQKKVLNILWTLVSIPRSQILSSSRRHTNDNNNRIPLVCRWNSHLPPLNKLLRESFPILQSNPHLRNTFDLPLVAYKRPRNLRDLLTSRPRADPKGPSKDRPNGTFPCEVARCKTCENVCNIETFRYKTNDTHLVQEHFTCASTSVVYLISCGHPKRNAVYVGETGCTLRERMNGHRFAVKNKTDTPVAHHFSTSEHSLKISVLQAAPTAVVQRRLLEKLWIERIEQSAQYRLLNRDEGLDIRTL